MGDFLTTVVGPPVSAGMVLLRLVGAFALGSVVAWVYGRTHPSRTTSSPFQSTLVLLAILIATVTQVVGESPARAFSLLGALSIIRFRTVVQDSSDTAFVIFAVVMGMAAGASAPWMAVIGLVVVSLAAFVTRTRRPAGAHAGTPSHYRLSLRVGLGSNVDAIVKGPFADHLAAYHVASMETTRHETAVELSYAVVFFPGGSPERLLTALSVLDGVQKVQIEVEEADDD